jgi:hypothetical protein
MKEVAAAATINDDDIDNNPMDFTFRVIESVAFSLHALLGITEPWTGCLKMAFRDNDNMVWWGWPVAGVALAFCAYANFAVSTMWLLAVQWYIVTFHFGAIWYHIRLGHHPAVGIAPGMFIPIALTIIGIRMEAGWWNILILPFGSSVCAFAAYWLCQLLVKAPRRQLVGGNGEEALLNS